MQIEYCKIKLKNLYHSILPTKTSEILAKSAPQWLRTIIT